MMRKRLVLYGLSGLLMIVAFNACENLEDDAADEQQEGLPEVLPEGSGKTFIIENDITSDRVLPNQIDDPEQPDYIVTSSIDVEADLIIEPGVRIEFEDDVSMTIASEGRIDANGSADAGIVLTSSNSEAGIHWKGLLVESGYSTNLLNFVEVSYAGNSRLSYENSSYRTANIVVSADARLAVTNCLVTNSKDEGMYVSGELIDFENNTFENNGSYAVSVSFNEVGKIDANTNIENNGGNNYIRIFKSEMISDQTMVALMNDQFYRVTGEITLESQLTISEGVKMAFDEDVFFRVGQENGNLIVEGTQSNKVIMTSSNTEAGIHWGGLDIASGYSTNKIDHAEISNGGSNRIFYENSAYRNATLGIQSNGKVAITNTLIANSDDEGIYCAGELLSFVNNSFEDNTGYAVSLAFNQAGQIDGATTFSGNGDDGVRVYGSTLEDDQEISTLAGDAYYLFTNDVTIAANTTIEAGAQLRFNQDVQLTVDEEGSLTATGTAGNAIVFTSSNQAANIHWAGILFSSSVNNELQYVEVSYGGSARLAYINSGYRYANIALHNASLDMNNCTLSNSTENGIVIGSNSTLNGLTHADTDPISAVISVNTISSNGADNVLFLN